MRHIHLGTVLREGSIIMPTNSARHTELTCPKEKHGQMINLMCTLNLEHKARPGFIHLLEVCLAEAEDQ